MTAQVTFDQVKKISENFEYKGISDPLAEFLFSEAASVSSENTIVEIGSFVGYSTIYLASGARSGNGARVHCIDPWGMPPSSAYSREKYAVEIQINEDTYKQFLANIKLASVEESVVPHRAYGHMFSKYWDTTQAIGLLFIDGDHSEWGAYADWFHYKKYLVDEALVVFHDYGYFEVANAIKRIPLSQIANPQIVGTGYKGNEAFAFRYRRSAGQPIVESVNYWFLSFKKWVNAL